MRRSSFGGSRRTIQGMSADFLGDWDSELELAHRLLRRPPGPGRLIAYICILRARIRASPLGR
jgi:hypothetical protein